jgi:hypothetical protein
LRRARGRAIRLDVAGNGDRPTACSGDLGYELIHSAWRLALTTTLAPSCAKSFADARPIPEFAPVTIATL